MAKKKDNKNLEESIEEIKQRFGEELL